MPKGTLWAQSNIIEAALAAFLPEGVLNAPSFSDGVAAIIAGDRRVLMPLPPLMHAAAQWMAMSAFLTGGTTVFPDVVDRLDPASVWKAIDAEGVQFVNLVGNAFATPMCDEYERGGYDGSTLQFVGVGGAVTSASVKDRILKLLPRAVIGDVAGSSETGSQLSRVSTSQAPATTGVFPSTSSASAASRPLATWLTPTPARSSSRRARRSPPARRASLPRRASRRSRRPTRTCSATTSPRTSSTTPPARFSSRPATRSTRRR